MRTLTVRWSGLLLGIFLFMASCQHTPERNITTVSNALEGRWIDEDGTAYKYFKNYEKYATSDDSTIIGGFTFRMIDSKQRITGMYYLTGKSTDEEAGQTEIRYVMSQGYTATGRPVFLEGDDRTLWEMRTGKDYEETHKVEWRATIRFRDNGHRTVMAESGIGAKSTRLGLIPMTGTIQWSYVDNTKRYSAAE